MKKNTSYRFFSYIIVIMLLLNASETFAQWTFDIVGTVKQQETKKRLAGATITIKKNGTVWKTLTVPDNGKFELNLLPDAIYIIEFSKPGLVTKRIQVSSKDVPPEDAKYGLEFPLEMNLFKKIDGLDVSILDKPIAKIKYDADIGYPNYDEAYTKSIKSELDRLKKELAAKLKKQADERKAKQAAYDDAIAAGNKAFSAKKWSEAQPFYTQASQIFADEDYPKNQLKLIAENIKKLANAAKEYTNTIALADAAFNKKDLNNALVNYKKANQLKPTEKYPKEKITAINALLVAQNKKEADYKAAIASADGFLTQKEYGKSKLKYQAAADLKPNEAYPKDKIAAIDKILANKAKAEADQKALDEKYKQAITQADASFNSKDYTVAKEKYQLAKSLKPTEKYPNQKLTEIASLLADKAKADAAQKALDEKYKQAIAQADAFLSSKSYDDAKLKYQAAADLKPSEAYPKDKIAAIDKILANKAKADADQKALNEKYKQAIAQADGALGSKNYDDAKLKYQAAADLKPNEAYPKNKIAAIDKILANKAKSDADQKALNEKYKQAITQADASFNNKDYTAAKEKYQLAKSLKPTEKYPNDKLTEIASLLANKAKSDADQKALDSKYQNFIAQADAFLSSKSYDDAKLKYQAALDLKPTEAYPKNKINEIDKILADAAKKQQDKQLAKEADKKKREYFNAIIAQADGELAAKKYQEAIKKYNEALGVIPNETYPTNKIKEINDVLAKLAANKQNALATKKALDEKYNNLIASGDAAFSTKDYTTAKTKFKGALAVKPTEKYPQDKIAAIDKILAELAKQKDENQAKNNALAQKKLKYQNFIKLADDDLSKKQYQKAIANYKSALGIMPNEAYPKNKIEEINKTLADKAKKEADSKNSLLAEKAKRKKYDDIIYKADRLFKLKKYETSKSKYNEALAIYANEQYPKNKIADIDALLQKQNQVAQKNTVISNTNLGARVKIDDSKEKEIEAKIAAMRNEKNKKKDKKLQDEVASVNKQEEIRITTAIDKTNNAWKNVKAANHHLQQLQRNGNRFSIQNNDSLLAFTKDINAAENARVAKADKDRLVTENQLAVQKKESLKYQEKANRNYPQKIDSQHVFVSDINEQQLVVIENADKKRAKNRQKLANLSDKMNEENKKNYERAKKQALDVKAYKKELNNNEQILITASLNRTANNEKAISNLVTQIAQSKVEAQKNYIKHDKNLAKEQAFYHQLAQQRVENADNTRALNVKELADVQEQIVANLNYQNKNYYAKLPKIKAYKEYLYKQDKTFRARAAVNRQKEKEALAISKAKLGVETQDQKDRYKEFVANLAEERKRNNDFQSDLVAIADEKRILANANLSNFYTPKKRMINNLSDLPKTYPQGITEEVKDNGNSIELKRTKVTGNHADIYKRIFYKWGGTFYTKNGVNITQALWNKESIEK